MKLGKLQTAHHTLRGHFAPAYLGGSIKPRAYLFFIYDLDIQKVLLHSYEKLSSMAYIFFISEDKQLNIGVKIKN